MSTVSLTLDEIFDLAKKTLLANGCDDETASILADLIRNAGEARAVDLAKHFGVTGPTVNSIIRRLVRDGLVVSKPYRSIFLTDKGQILADYCKKRHEIVYNFLIKIGVNSDTAKNDAEGMLKAMQANLDDFKIPNLGKCAKIVDKCRKKYYKLSTSLLLFCLTK